MTVRNVPRQQKSKPTDILGPSIYTSIPLNLDMARNCAVSLAFLQRCLRVHAGPTPVAGKTTAPSG